MDYHLSLITIALWITAIALAVLGIRFYLNRKIRGSFAFSLLMFSAGLWAVAAAMEAAAYGVEAKIFWSKISYIGIVMISPCWLLFALEYSNAKQGLTTKIAPLLFAIPIAIIAMVFTNEYHHLIWPSVTLSSATPWSVAIYEHGTVFYINMAYAYLLLLAGTILLIRYILISGIHNRAQVVSLLVGVFIPWLANFIYVAFPNIIRGIEITPFAFAITGALVAFSIIKYKFMDILPTAQQVLFENLDSGIIVADKNDVIVAANTLARELLGETVTTGALLPKLFDLNSNSTLSKYVQIKDRWFLTKTQLFHTGKNKLAGRIFVLDDYTEEKAIQDKLQQSKELFEEVVNFLPDPTFVIDKSGKVVIWNKSLEKLTGKPAKELIGKTNKEYSNALYGKKRPLIIDMLLDTGVPNSAWEQYHDIRRRGNTVSGKLFGATINGKTYNLWVIGSTLVRKSGEVYGAIETIRDITEEGTNEAKLLEKVEELSKMNQLMVTRELKMVELKDEIQRLKSTANAKQLSQD